MVGSVHATGLTMIYVSTIMFQGLILLLNVLLAGRIRKGPAPVGLASFKTLTEIIDRLCL